MGDDAFWANAAQLSVVLGLALVLEARFLSRGTVPRRLRRTLIPSGVAVVLAGFSLSFVFGAAIAHISGLSDSWMSPFWAACLLAVAFGGAAITPVGTLGFLLLTEHVIEPSMLRKVERAYRRELAALERIERQKRDARIERAGDSLMLALDLLRLERESGEDMPDEVHAAIEGTLLSNGELRRLEEELFAQERKRLKKWRRRVRAQISSGKQGLSSEMRRAVT